jgi:hypothetical protein
MKKTKQIEVGDLVMVSRIHRLPFEIGFEARNLTGIVLAVVLDDVPNPNEFGTVDYWVRVAFLDGTISTLFCDEVELVDKDTKI